MSNTMSNRDTLASDFYKALSTVSCAWRSQTWPNVAKRLATCYSLFHFSAVMQHGSHRHTNFHPPANPKCTNPTRVTGVGTNSGPNGSGTLDVVSNERIADLASFDAIVMESCAGDFHSRVHSTPISAPAAYSSSDGSGIRVFRVALRRGMTFKLSRAALPFPRRAGRRWKVAGLARLLALSVPSALDT